VHISVLLNLTNPVPDGLERSTVRHIIDEKDALRPSEVGRGDGSKTFLPSRIPDLEFDSFAVQFKIFNFKVDAVGE